MLRCSRSFAFALLFLAAPLIEAEVIAVAPHGTARSSVRQEVTVAKPLRPRMATNQTSVAWWSNYDHATGYLKLITPIVATEGNMFSIHIFGYRFQGGSNESFDIRCGGYAYAGDNYGLYLPNCTTVGTDLRVELAEELRTGARRIVVRLGGPDTSWYFPHVAAEYVGWNPKTSADFQWIIGESTPAGTGNTNQVIVNGSAGTLTIGTDPAETATTRLTVNGSMTVSGAFAAKYQDIAEWVPASGDLSPGTVVVLMRSAVNTVTPSTSAYDSRVAGVISAQPGISLGEAGEKKELVATTGRVRVRVNTSSGAIEAGDLLVTSSEEGTAMKSEPVSLGGSAFHRPGTIIGKALEPMASGDGEILVLLSLQ